MTSTEFLRAALAADALRLLDISGEDAMTVDTLVEESGRTEAEVRQVLGEAHVLDLACEAVYSQLNLAPINRPWPAKLRFYARGLREVLVSHPSAVIPIATRPIVSTDVMVLVESAISSLTEVGFDDEEANRVLLVIVNYVIGHCLTEVGVNQQLDHRAAVREFRENLPVDELPHAAVALHDAPDRDAEFELGLNLLVDGLERRLLHG